MAALLTRPPKPGTETPLYQISTHRGFSNPASMLIGLHRVDGLPETDAYGEKLRSDPENWMTARETLALIALIMGSLPRY